MQRKNWFVFLSIFLIAVFLSGCATAPMASLAHDSSAKEFKSQPAKARITIDKSLIFSISFIIAGNKYLTLKISKSEPKGYGYRQGFFSNFIKRCFWKRIKGLYFVSCNCNGLYPLRQFLNRNYAWHSGNFIVENLCSNRYCVTPGHFTSNRPFQFYWFIRYISD